MNHRVFFSLLLPQEFTRAVIDDYRKFPGLREYRWEKPYKLHITIKFFGETNDDEFAEIQTRLEEMQNEFRSVILKPKGYGIFYHKIYPKILYLGFEENSELENIFKSVNKKINIGESNEKPGKLVPHVTLCRIKRMDNDDLIDFFDGRKLKHQPIVCSSYVFFESQLNPGGSIYKKIKVFKGE